MATKLVSEQLISKSALSSLASADAELDNILSSINSQATPPLYMSENGGDRVLNISALSAANPETSRNKSINPINNTLPTFASGTVTLDATGAGNATPSVGSAIALGMSASQFLKIMIFLDQNGDLLLSAGTAGASLAAATIPNVVADTLPIGYLVVRTDGSNNVANIAATDVYQFSGNSVASSGGASGNVTSAKSADYTITDIDGIDTILMTTAGTDRTVTLPTAADNANRQITIKKVDSGTGRVTIDGEGAETIDGNTTMKIFAQYGRLTVVCDGTSWHVVEYAGGDPIGGHNTMTFQNNDGLTFTNAVISEQIVGDCLHVAFSFRTSGTGTNSSELIIDLIKYPNLLMTPGTYGAGSALTYNTSEALNCAVVAESTAGQIKIKQTSLAGGNIRGTDFSSAKVDYVSASAMISLN